MPPDHTSGVLRSGCQPTLVCCVRDRCLRGQGPALFSAALLKSKDRSGGPWHLSFLSLLQTASLHQTDMGGACLPGSSDIPSHSLARLEHPPLPCVTHQAVHSCPSRLDTGPDVASNQEGRGLLSPALRRETPRPASLPLRYLPSQPPAACLSQGGTASCLVTKLHVAGLQGASPGLWRVLWPPVGALTHVSKFSEWQGVCQQ